eukprot:gene8387-biopygen3785
MGIYSCSRLSVLALSDNNLLGTISPLIGNLNNLTRLLLNANNFNGSIPEEITTLQQLQVLALGDNWFTGSIPSSVATLEKLIWLYVEANSLTGSVPSSIGALSMLEIASFSWNNLTGTIPPSIGNLSQLAWLFLGTNGLTGSIPTSIGRLSQLKGLYLYDNHLTGTIPSAIGQLSNLEGLHISGNALTGTIPVSMSDLNKLKLFVVSGNILTGTIPPFIAHLPELTGLYLDTNRLTGTIPASLGAPPLLTVIYLFSNALNGSIPASIGNLQYLLSLQVFANALTGAIPASIGSSSVLVELFLYTNMLTGTIPMLTTSTDVNASLTPAHAHTHGCRRNHLHSCFLSENFLTGPLPPCFEFLSDLRYFGVDNNPLSINGSQLFPPNLDYLDLSGIGLNDSQLVDRLLQLNFTYVSLAENAFGGRLPASVWDTAIQQLLLNDNRFSGAFPAREDRSCSLNYVSISANQLTGTLPLDLSVCDNLTAFFATNMSLTGPVTGRFSRQRWLQTVAIANNAFTGPIDDVFTGSGVSNWILNAGYNALTGTLPVERLSTGHFQSLMLLVNCLSGTLPAEALCKNQNMSELLLSGLHTAPACRQLFLPVWSGGWTYIESNAVRGSIPSCLLSSAMPQLTYLALSGNLFTGSIARDVTVSPTMMGVDLSHNALTGPIPRALVEAELSLLDLSFNRFSGTVAETATRYYATATDAQVSLAVNMLSGTLPASWVDAINIDVLNGNLFACTTHSLLHVANKPVHDPLSATYACGSSLTNVSLLVFVSAMVVTLLMVVVSQARRWKSGLRCVERVQTEVTRLLMTCQSLVGIHRWRNACGMFVFLAVSVGIYAVMTTLTSAYAQTYVWVVSISLQQGTVVGSLLLIWLFVVCGWVHYRADADAANHVAPYAFSIRRYSRQLAASRHDGTAEAAVVVVSWWTALSVAFALLCTHVMPVFVVNLLYVYTTTLSLPLWLRSTIVACMSLFKLSWNTLMLYGRRGVPLNDTGHPRAAEDVSAPPRAAAHEVFVDAMRLYASVINLIVVPAVTEMLISPNCFQYLFTTIATNSYVVQGSMCYWISYTENREVDKIAVACMSMAELQATYNSGSEATRTGNYDLKILSTYNAGEASEVAFSAGFAYNFQCTFSLLEAFVYIFVYKYVCRLVVLQGLWAILKQLQTYWYNRYGPSNGWFRCINDCSPFLMRLIDGDGVDCSTKHRREEVRTYNTTLLQRWRREQQCERTAKRLKMRVVSDLAIALSFGLLFPLLGMLALVGVVVDLLMTHWMLDRLRRYAERMRGAPPPVAPVAAAKTVDQSIDKEGDDDDAPTKPRTMVPDDGSQAAILSNDEYADCVLKAVDDTRAACIAQLRSVPQQQPTLLFFSALMWSLGLFDIVGRQTGAVAALWIFLVTLTMPEPAGSQDSHDA